MHVYLYAYAICILSPFHMCLGAHVSKPEHLRIDSLVGAHPWSKLFLPCFAIIDYL